MRSISPTCIGSINPWISSGYHCSNRNMVTSGTVNNAAAAHMQPASLRTSRGKSASRNSTARCQRGAGVRYSRLWPRCISTCKRVVTAGL